MNVLLTSIVIGLVAAEPRPEDMRLPHLGSQPQDLYRALGPPADPAPRGEAEQRLAGFYAERIQEMPWEWDDEKALLSTSIDAAKQQGFEVRFSMRPRNIGRIVLEETIIEVKNGDRSWQAPVHEGTPFVIRDDRLVYVNLDANASQAELVMVNLTDGKVIWKRPFTRYLRGAGGSYRGRQFSLELTRDAVIATSQDNFAKFRDIRSLATGAKLATRVYP